ncbi:MAG: hypothetical protein ABSE73_14820 [Planctomycetota bacterium]
MPEDNAIQRHCAEIERCNQRGGRMLSIVDLIEAGTLSRELAAHALAAIGNGASFLVGARPGGAGKTTVMCALLNFVPRDVELAPADGMEAIAAGRAICQNAPQRRCYICHEIGSGPYYAYLWGAELRAYFALPQAGHILATNLHADTYAEARNQICVENGVAEAALRRLHLMFFLSVRRRGQGVVRRIESVWESDGSSTHRQILAADGSNAGVEPSSLVPAQELTRAREAIEQILKSGARTIEEVRAAVLLFLKPQMNTD